MASRVVRGFETAGPVKPSDASALARVSGLSMAWHAACGYRPHMPRASSRRAGPGQSVLRLLARGAMPSGAPPVVPISLRVTGRRMAAPPTFGRLRRAPRLSLLGGGRREPDWRSVAAGVGAAVIRRGDTQDAPRFA